MATEDDGPDVLPEGVQSVRVIAMTDAEGKPVDNMADAVNIEVVEVLDDGSQRRVYIGPDPA